MDAKHVAQFVEQKVWPAHCSDGVVIELLTVDKRSETRAMIGWAGDHWHVLADCSADPESLLFALCHELAHVVHGDMPGSRVADLSIDREIMQGAQTPSTRARAAAWQAHDGANAARIQERRATAWAREQAALWWGLCVSTGRA